MTIPEIDNKLNKEIFDLPYEEIIVDFSGVSMMNQDFASHYLLNRSKSEKIIHEVNVPPSFQDRFNDSP